MINALENQQFSINPADRKIAAGDIVALLDRRHNGPTGEYAGFAELRTGTGAGKGCEQYLDYWTVGCWSKNGHAMTYEIKVSRSDWLTEKKKPLKKRMGLLYSNYFYFIAPKGIIKPEEVPYECGLIEVFWANNDEKISQWNRWRKEDWEKATESERESGWATTKYGRTNLIPPPQPETYNYLDQKIVVQAPYREMFVTYNLLATVARRVRRQIEKGSEAIDCSPEVES